MDIDYSLVLVSATDSFSILILDSNTTARSATARRLSARGLTIYSADTAADAITQLEEHVGILAVLLNSQEHDIDSFSESLYRVFGVDRVFACLPLTFDPAHPEGGHALCTGSRNDSDPLYEAVRTEVSRRFEQIDLREQILRNQALTRVIPDAMFVFDAKGVYQEVHAPDQGALVRPARELIGKSIAEVMGTEVHERHLRQVAEARADGDHRRPRPFRYEARTGNESRYFESILTLIDDERSLVVVRDVTTEQRYHSQKHEQAQYQATIHAISRRFMQASPETADTDLLFAMRKLGHHLGVDWVTIGLNTGASGVLKVTHHWRKNGPSFPPVLEDSGPLEIPMNVPAMVRAMEQKGYLDIHDTGAAPEGIEAFAQDMERYGLRSLLAFPLVERQQIVGALVVSCMQPRPRMHVRDITLVQVVARLINDSIIAQRSYRRIEQTTEGFETLFALSLEGLLIHRDGLLIHANEAFARMFGYERSELSGCDIHTLIRPEYHHLCLSDRGNDSQSRQTVAGVHRNGEDLWLEIECRPVPLEDGQAELIAFHDVSHHIEREAQIERLLHEKERLIKDIHHRLKNQMLSIESLLSLKSQEVGTASSASALNETRNHVHGLALLYDRLYRSTESSDLLTASGYLPTLIQDIIRLSAHQAGLEARIDIADTKLTVRRLSRLGMILNELISNTVKHAYPETDGGQARSGIVTIMLAETASGELTLSYSDDGRGIPEAVANGHSAGLGMDLVRAFSEEIGGTLTVSGSSAGTAVRLVFPSG